MDFDEYEYLEKTVENPDASMAAVEINGNGGIHGRSRTSRHRRDDSDRSAERHRSKSARNEEDRRSSRHGERSRLPSGRERDREREDRSGKERERERERSRRSSSRSERQHNGEEHLGKHRERSREVGRDEKELRERDKESRERDHNGRHYKEKKEDVPEPEADPERDQRTVFAYQISLKADERDVYEFFSRAGKVRDVRLIMDRNSRRSKGVGYIEFYDAFSVPVAITLSGQLLFGQPVMVKPSEAEKNLVQSTATSGAAAGGIGPYSGGARRLYVGNLPYNIKEDQLRQVFESFGIVELVQLPIDPETGNGKGYGFVQFARLEDARAAQSLNGQLPIAGKTIKVSAVTDQSGAQVVGTNAGDLDDDEGGGLALNAHSRALLMRKLDRSDTTTSDAAATSHPAVNAALLSAPTASVLGVPPVIAPILQSPVPSLLGLPGQNLPAVPAVSTETIVPTECLLLKNMFDPNVETQPDFYLDVQEDVQEECSKFGCVKHIFVDKNTCGFVYLRFDTVNSAISAQRALNGRWFAGKMVSASFMQPQQYMAKFPDSH